MEKNVQQKIKDANIKGNFFSKRISKDIHFVMNQ